MSDEATIVMCDFYPDERASMSYQYEWGETGNCSHRGQFLAKQRAQNLKRGITFVPLHLPAAPLERGERTMLIAEKLAAQGERDEVIERNQRLYAQNTELAADVRQLKLRNEQIESERVRLVDEGMRLQEQLARHAMDLRETRDALARSERIVSSGVGEANAQIAELTQALDAARAKIAELQGA